MLETALLALSGGFYISRPKTTHGPTSQTYISLRLHYADWGNADAPSLILLHGGRDHCCNYTLVQSATGNAARTVSALSRKFIQLIT